MKNNIIAINKLQNSLNILKPRPFSQFHSSQLQVHSFQAPTFQAPQFNIFLGNSSHPQGGIYSNNGFPTHNTLKNDDSENEKIKIFRIFFKVMFTSGLLLDNQLTDDRFFKNLESPHPNSTFSLLTSLYFEEMTKIAHELFKTHYGNTKTLKFIDKLPEKC